MSNPDRLVLRILSGPHLGAEVRLPAGQYTVGTEDSCDLILHDSSVAARHASLDVREVPEGGIKVVVTPLDGTLLMNSEAHSESFSLPPEQLCFLGLTSIAWISTDVLPEEAASIWINLTDGLQISRLAATADNGQEAGNTAEDQDSGQSDNSPLSMTDSGGDGAKKNKKRGFWHPLRRWGGFFLSLFLLSALILHQEYKDVQPDAALVAENMAAAGITGLKVTQDPRGIIISGILPDDASRAALLRLARTFFFPVLLDVSIASDKINAVMTAFTSRGFYPGITYSPDKKRLIVTAYVKNPGTEAWLFKHVAEDLTGETGKDSETDLPFTPRIYYAEELRTTLEPALAQAGLDSARVDYLAGSLDITGVFDVAQNRQLRKVLAAVEAKLGIPLHIRRIGAPRAAPAEEPEQPVQDPPPVQPFSPEAPASLAPELHQQPTYRFRITSVTVNPMRFITLDSGERVFEGGTMPDGSILESISVHNLRLRKDDIVYSYLLRGSK